jgi:hypothetical protein
MASAGMLSPDDRLLDGTPTGGVEITAWHFRRDGREFGPFTTGQFLQMAAAGMLLPTDELSGEGGTPSRASPSPESSQDNPTSPPRAPADPISSAGDEHPAREPAGNVAPPDTQTVKCPECRGVVGREAQHCPHCGQPQASDKVYECPNCRVYNSKHRVVCRACGEVLEHSLSRKRSELEDSTLGSQDQRLAEGVSGFLLAIPTLVMMAAAVGSTFLRVGSTYWLGCLVMAVTSAFLLYVGRTSLPVFFNRGRRPYSRPLFEAQAAMREACDQLRKRQADTAFSDTLPSEHADAVLAALEASDKASEHYLTAGAVRFVVGRLAVLIGVPIAFFLAIHLMRPSVEQRAERGDAGAQVEMGLRALSADTAEGNAEAASWFRKAALQGHPAGMFGLGKMYQGGRRLPKDQGKAVELIRRAAELGFAPAQIEMGRLHESGEGVPRDIEEAVLWYRKAAAQDFEDAEKRLRELGRE